MSRLFAIARTMEEIVARFSIDVPPSFDVPSETVEGAPGALAAPAD